MWYNKNIKDHKGGIFMSASFEDQIMPHGVRTIYLDYVATARRFENEKRYKEAKGRYSAAMDLAECYPMEDQEVAARKKDIERCDMKIKQERESSSSEISVKKTAKKKGLLARIFGR